MKHSLAPGHCLYFGSLQDSMFSQKLMSLPSLHREALMSQIDNAFMHSPSLHLKPGRPGGKRHILSVGNETFG